MKLSKLLLLLLVLLAVFFFTTNRYKPGSAVKNSVEKNPDQFFRTNTPAERRKSLEESKPANKPEELQRQAFLYEADRDYAKALKNYKQIMEMEGIEADMKAITHVALQRCYAFLRDGDNEFRELLWLRDNMLAPKSEYNHLMKHLSAKTMQSTALRLKQYISQVENRRSSIS